MQPYQSENPRLYEKNTVLASNDDASAKFLPRPPSRETNRLLRRTQSNPENADGKHLPVLKAGKLSKVKTIVSSSLEPIVQANETSLKLTRIPEKLAHAHSVESEFTSSQSARHKKLERSQTAPVAVLKPLKLTRGNSEELRKNACKLNAEQQSRLDGFSNKKSHNYDSGVFVSKSTEDLRKNRSTLTAERLRVNAFISRKSPVCYDTGVSHLSSKELAASDYRANSPVMKVLPNGRRIVQRSPQPPNSPRSRIESTRNDHEMAEIDSTGQPYSIARTQQLPNNPNSRIESTKDEYEAAEFGLNRQRLGLGIVSPSYVDQKSGNTRQTSTKDDGQTCLTGFDSRSDLNEEELLEVKQNHIRIDRKEELSEVTYLTFARDRHEDNNRI